MNYTYDDLRRMSQGELVELILAMQLAYNIQQQNIEMLRTALKTLKSMTDTL